MGTTKDHFMFGLCILNPKKYGSMNLQIKKNIASKCCASIFALPSSIKELRWFEEEMNFQPRKGYIENGKDNDITHTPYFPVLQWQQAAQSRADYKKRMERE